MSTSSKQNVKTKRNWMENDSLIAEGILSLLRKGRGVEQVRNTEIALEIGMTPVEVHRHLSQRDFFARNIEYVASQINRHVSDVPIAYLPTVLLACVREHRCWFEIEFERQSYRLYEEIMSALETKITASWAIHIGKRKPLLYQLLCSQVFVLLRQWIQSGFTEEQEIIIETKLAQLLAAFATGQINTIWNAIFY